MKDFSAAEEFVARGKKIQAIKEFRSQTRVGLKDAKESVEYYQSHGEWPAQYRHEPTPDVQPAHHDPLSGIGSLVAQGKVIPAIKELRSITGWGLKDSKYAVDEYRERGVWPARLIAAVGEAQPGSPPPSTTPTPAPGRRAEIEAFVAQGKKIMAIKVLREVTGWGLRESKDAVEDYQARGSWTPELLAVLGESPEAPAQPPAPAVAVAVAAEPEPRQPPSPSPSPSPSPASDPEHAPLLAALERHLGHPPTIRLAARAQRMPYDGHLVMLEDRACFARDDRGQWVVDPVIWYREVTEVEIQTGLGMDLQVSVGYVRERFSHMDQGDAEAALALFRAYAG